MNFREYIEQHKPEVYSKICDYLLIKNPIEHYKIIRDYSDRQSSYRRPGFLMLVGQMLGASIDDLLLPAAAIQLSEDWILIHDDIEDHSTMRRGKESLNKIYGIEVALNAGDAAHIVMWKMLKDYMVNNKQGSLVYDKFYDMAKKTAEGQFLDINFIYNKKNFGDINEELYLEIIIRKTCYYSIYGPMQLGAIIANASQETIQILENIGKPAGIAFQILDDLQDIIGNNRSSGKQKYEDLYEGKITLIMIYTYQNATQEEKSKINNIYAKARENKTKDDINFLLYIIFKYSSLDYARKIGEGYIMEANKNIKMYSSKFADNEYLKILKTAIDEFYKALKNLNTYSNNFNL